MSRSFPVLEILPSLKAKLRDHQIVILQAPPGAGKSTVLPLQLLDEPWLDSRKIILLQPRRLAARSVAQRMADVLEEPVGKTAGYRIRFETKVSQQTRIEVVTEGILTRMIQSDNALEETGLVVFDEFHERSLQADLALALCLQLQKILRPDLRILIMSATLDGDRISAILGGAPVITATGRQFPVEHRYLGTDKIVSLPIQMARAIRKALAETQGDLLAFFPGAGEINKTRELLESENITASLHPLFGDLSMKKQQEAILPLSGGRRKVVMATSIAETSLTIEGITVVVDCGFARVSKFDPKSGLNRLETTRVTLDSADQRSGRAGRLGPGVCYRLWTEAMNRQLVHSRTPEILDADLAPLILELMQWGVRNVNELTWITAPPSGAVNQAMEILEQLEAISEHRITDRGRKMLSLPTHPRIAHMLLSPPTWSENREKGIALAADIAALLEERDPVSREAGADLGLRVDALRKWRHDGKTGADRNALERIERLSSAWRSYFKITPDNSAAPDTDIGKLLAAAYPERIGRQVSKNSERYKLTNGRIARLPAHDPLMREMWLSIAQLDAGLGEGKIFLAAPIHEDDLLSIAQEREKVYWDAEGGRVVGVVEKRIENLVLQSRPMAKIPDEQRINVLLNAVRDEGLKILGWSEIHEAWQSRVLAIRRWRPDEAWPDVTESALLDTLETWLGPFLSTATKRADLSKIDLIGLLSGLISWELQGPFDALVPEKIQVPSGSMIKVKYYTDGQPPSIEVRLQEVFGLLETPTVNGGSMRLVLHLLSPGYKPVQVTQDLKSFWQTTYHEVRSELKRRYPRHSWPEDPWTAEAVRGARRRT